MSDDRLRNKMSNYWLTYVRRYFDWDRTVKKIMNIYQRFRSMKRPS
jgi:glycosyltransferase involved in cell wall biosynthesis